MISSIDHAYMFFYFVLTWIVKYIHTSFVVQQKIKSILVNAPRTEERPIDSAVWNSWKSRSLSYFLDKRTIRLVSGASLLFSAPKSQWIQVFQRMDISSQLEESLCEIVVSQFIYLFKDSLLQIFCFENVFILFPWRCPGSLLTLTISSGTCYLPLTGGYSNNLTGMHFFYFSS